MSQLATRPRPGRSGLGWQLILADLALILFLLTLSALPAAEAGTGPRIVGTEPRARDPRRNAVPEHRAAAQALYREVAGGPRLGDWLRAQAPDPRATLTLVITHPARGEAAAWRRAEALAAEARAAGARVRTIIVPGPAAAVEASLGYDLMVIDAQAGAPQG
jgi:hypothetical protein